MMLLGLSEALFIPSCVVTVFRGWRVVATSFEVGCRIYACADGGRVVVLNFPLCRFEVRFTTSSSVDAIGTDADRLEFRFLSPHDGIDVACPEMMVPPAWLVVSRVSGRTMTDNSKWRRRNDAGVEGPDQNHLTCQSPLIKCQRALVPAQALALQNHDAHDEQETVVWSSAERCQAEPHHGLSDATRTSSRG